MQEKNKINTEISERILQIIDLEGDNKNTFAQKLGYKRSQTIYDIVNGKSAPSFDFFNRFINSEYSESYYIDWLITGKSPMLKSQKPVNSSKNNKSAEIGIPLIPVEAMAGYANGDTQIMEYESERFVIPTFRGADYLISVRGSSMYPKYNSGDIIACKRLPLDTFFQWNKVYVLDTAQGALTKRVCKGSDDDHILLVSDNEKYNPFQLHRSEIRSIAIVMGVVRLE